MLENCSVIVCSCDKNEDLWDMFFYYMKKNWLDYDYNKKIYLNTESKKYRHSDFDVVTFSHFPNGDKTRWSYRLRRVLENVEDDFVLLILDDFFLTDTVMTEEIEWCLDKMKKDDNIAVFLFDPTPGPNKDSKYRNYLRKDNKAPFRMSLQVGMWNRKHLLKYLRNHEMPWQFETWGSIRSRRYKEDFYAIKEGIRRPFEYPWGGVVADNKWNGKKSCQFLIDDFGIDLEGTRGIYEKGDARKTEISHRTFLKKCWDVFKSLI